MSLDFVRDGITRPDSLGSFSLPTIFSKNVVMLSSLRTDTLQNFRYSINGVDSFESLILAIGTYIHDDVF